MSRPSVNTGCCLISYSGAAENIVAADCPQVWFGEIDAPFWTPLFIMNGRNTLELLCQPHDKNVTLGFCGNDFSVALRMYAKGNGGRMADARGRRWVKIAAAAMNNDWLVLCPSEAFR